MIHLDVFEGVEASVNAYIFSDDEQLVLVDCLRNSKEARMLAEELKKYNKPLTHLLITHGHPDHYLGMNEITQAFPEVKVVVGSAAIKEDIINFSAWMEGVGWMDNEPAMKPVKAGLEGGFDYEQVIGVLPQAEIRLGDNAVLELQTDYPSAECEHLTTIFCKELNVFLAGDFCYNHVHPWLAIDRQNIDNWKNQLDKFFAAYEIIDPIIYPGHGEATNVAFFKEMKRYILTFEETVASAGPRQEAMDLMMNLYPDYTQADFLLLYSVNAFVKE